MRRFGHEAAERAVTHTAPVSSFPADLPRGKERRAASKISSGGIGAASLLRAVPADARRSSTRALIVCAALSLHGNLVSAAEFPARSKSADVLADAVGQWSGLLAEASSRSGLPVEWLHDLMRAESNGNASAASVKGAVGLMQLMPGTYAALRAPLGLGANPFRPRDNILAGAVYLRLLVDRYGWPRALAAYNAGPARLDAFLTRGRALPNETLAYLSKFRSAQAAGAFTNVSIHTSASADVARLQPQPTPRPTLFATMTVPSAVEASVGVKTTPSPRTEPPTWRESSLFIPATVSAARP